MELTDVRRLTGPNFLLDRAGACAEIIGRHDDIRAFLPGLAKTLSGIASNVDWGHETIQTRLYPGGGSIAITAPIDALYAATSLIETAWDFETDDNSDRAARIKSLQAEIDEERNPRILAMRDAALKHGKAFLSDDDDVSIGLGLGRTLWDVRDLPMPSTVDWDAVSNIPVALVTGTNGKSTTVRLASAIAAKAGRMAASSSSDYVRVGPIVLDTGDYSGPGGARMALRDTRADMAILETARGGLMRRGLPITNIEASLITNISADHLGEYGITDVEVLADAKFMLAKAVSPSGCLILNWDDPALTKRAEGFEGQISWFGLSIDTAFAVQCAARGQTVAYVDDGVMMLACGGETVPVLPVKDFPIAMGGAAKFNIANGLAAIALASALDLDVDSMRAGLADFESTPENNPGRGNFMSVGGATVLLDFAHNPHGVSALASAIKDMPAPRKLFLLGQAGDRSDTDIIDITKAVHSADPDMIIVKELPSALRGRQPGETSKVILGALESLSVPTERIMQTGNEFDATIKALEWAQPGDFLGLLVYVERARVLAYLQQLMDMGWTCGDPLPLENKG